MVTLCRVVTEENRFVTYLIADCKSAVILRGELEIPANKKSLLSALLKCPHGLQPTNERRAESKLTYAMPSKEEEDKVKSLRTRILSSGILNMINSLKIADIKGTRYK